MQTYCTLKMFLKIGCAHICVSMQTFYISVDISGVQSNATLSYLNQHFFPHKKSRLVYSSVKLSKEFTPLLEGNGGAIRHNKYVFPTHILYSSLVMRFYCIVH